MSSFVQEHEQHRPRIVVELPELRKTSGGLFSAREVMTYAVCVQGGNPLESPRAFPKHGVRHRYSDFEALSLRLQRRFGTEGMLVPPLPPKSLRKNQDVDFIKQRMNGLQFFMEGIAASPFLFHDVLTQKFLKRTTTEGAGSIAALLDEGDTAVGHFAPLPSSSSNPPSSPLSSASLAAMHNRGYVQWTEFLSSFVLPPDPDMMVEKIRLELETCERILTEVLEGGRALAAGFGQYARGSQAFSRSMHVLAEGERRVEVLNKIGTTEEEKDKEEEGGGGSSSSNSNSTVTSSPLLMYTTPLPELASRTADLYANIVPNYLAAPDQASFLFASLLEYEQSRIHSLKSLLAGRDDLHTSILKLQKKVHSLRQPSASPADRELCESRLAKEEVRLYKFTKALLCYTLPAVAQQRTWNLNRALANLAAISTSAAAASLSQAMGYLKVLGWDATEIVEEANESGAALLVPPIPIIALPQAAGDEKKKQQQQAGATRKTGPPAAAAAAAARKPGSLLLDKPAPLPSAAAAVEAGEGEEKRRGSSGITGGSGGSGSSITTTLPTMDSIVTAAAVLGSGGGKGASGKAPWDSDDEAENPFEKKEGVGANTLSS